MKPAIQASNIRFCDINSNSLTVKWDNGDGDRRIVVFTPEKIVREYTESTVQGSTSSFGDNGYCSTAENPDSAEVRFNWPGYDPSRGAGNQFGGEGCGDSSETNKCDPTVTWVAPDESLPIDGTTYKSNIVYGDGDELFITNRGLTSSDPTLCPNPSPSPSPSTGYELITETENKNGSFVVYEGIDDEVTVLNLEPDTGYYVSVYEFNEECIEYLVEPNSRLIITSCKVETCIVTISVSDCRTCRPVVAMVEITDKCGKIRDLGSTDKCGEFKSRNLEVATGYKIKVIAANYDEYTINNAYMKPKADISKSELHPNWTQGTRVISQYSTDPYVRNDNHYDVKL